MLRSPHDPSALACSQILERRLSFGEENATVYALDERISLDLLPGPGWICRATPTSVEVSPLVLEILWCLGYFQLAADTHWSLNARIPNSETTAAINLTTVPALSEATALANWVLHRWLRGNKAAWPAHLPQPDAGLRGRAGAVTALAASAFGFIYRHELAHVHLGHHGCCAAAELEIEADRQAIEWSIDGITEGSQIHDVAMLGIGLGLETIMIAELWSRPSRHPTHPPAHARLNLLDGYIADENHRVWKQMALMLPIHVQTAGEVFPPRVYASFRECADECLEILARRAQRRSRG